MGRREIILLLVLLCVASAHAAVTDEQRLAALSAKMLNLTTPGHDYAMDCGPASEVLPLLPQVTDINTIAGNSGISYYCVLNTSGMLTFGTFGDPTIALPIILSIYNDSVYRSQIQVADINVKACAGSVGVTGFVECPGAIKYTIAGHTTTLHTYVYSDTLVSGATYIIVSERAISDGSFWNSLGDAITNVFNTILGWL